MKRTILLSILLCAITAAAAWAGWERQLSQAGGAAENVPIDPGAQQSAQQPPQQQEEPSSQPPRFVYDEPFESAASSFEESSSPSPSQGSSSAAEIPPQSVPEENSAGGHTEASVSAVEPEQEGRPPTAQEIDEVSAGHIRELEALISRMTASLDTLAQQAMTDYRMLTDPNDEAQIGILIERYLPSLFALEQDADAEAAVILENLENALLAIGADTSLAAQKRLDYEAAKAAQLGYYKELASAYVRQSAGT